MHTRARAISKAGIRVPTSQRGRHALLAPLDPERPRRHRQGGRGRTQYRRRTTTTMARIIGKRKRHHLNDGDDDRRLEEKTETETTQVARDVLWVRSAHRPARAERTPVGNIRRGARRTAR